jgi:hypothetical protein
VTRGAGLFVLRVQFALGRVADGILAALAQGGEVLLDALQNAAGAGFDGGTLRLDIRRARFAYRGDPHERDLARRPEISEMRLNAFDQPVSSGLRRGATASDVAAARLNDRDVLSKGRRCRDKNEQRNRETEFSHLSLPRGEGPREHRLMTILRRVSGLSVARRFTNWTKEQWTTVQ